MEWKNERRHDLARFFADPANPEAVLLPGAEGDHCRNIRLALERLEYGAPFAHLPLSDVFDDNASQALKHLQGDRKHSSVDGQCGPRSRLLLVDALLEQAAANGGDVDPFARMMDPERRGDGEIFASYTHADEAHLQRFADLIRGWGYSLWYDEGLAGGEKFSNTLMKRIEHAYLVLALESPAAAQSTWVLKEVAHADSHGVRILAIELAPAGVSPLGTILDNHHRIGMAPDKIDSDAAALYRGKLRRAIRAAHAARHGGSS
nr:toll/interleukin-1 receptor domain-containing protein [Nitrosomonas nitrosa]